jgi:Fe-S-cluster containining protein
MSKLCIFNTKGVCTDCGECYKCDLSPIKQCSNCGKCLQQEGIDIKAIKIDEITEDKHESPEENKPIQDIQIDTVRINQEDTEYEYPEHTDYTLYEAELYSENYDVWELIGDIEEFNDLLEDEDKRSRLTKELFPGLITIKNE